MNKLALFTLGALAAVAAFAGQSAATADKPRDQIISGPPSGKRLSYVMPKPGDVNSGNVAVGPATMLLDGKPVNLSSGIEAYKTLSREVHKTWAFRRTFLPKDADPYNVDGYSKELYNVPAWLFMLSPETLTHAQITSAINGTPVDEFGRSKPGHYGSADNSLWGQTLGGLLKNPLFKAIVVTALVAAGPEGAAIVGAYAMWEARGRELTLKNAVLVAGRAYVTAECGAACGMAFDFGVGAASGKRLDRAAEETLLAQMTPAQKNAYDQGKKLSKGAF